MASGRMVGSINRCGPKLRTLVSGAFLLTKLLLAGRTDSVFAFTAKSRTGPETAVSSFRISFGFTRSSGLVGRRTSSESVLRLQMASVPHRKNLKF